MDLLNDEIRTSLARASSILKGEVQQLDDATLMMISACFRLIFRAVLTVSPVIVQLFTTQKMM